MGIRALLPLGLATLSCSAALHGALSSQSTEEWAAEERRKSDEARRVREREQRESMARAMNGLEGQRERENAEREKRDAQRVAAIEARRPKPLPEPPRDPITDWLARAPAQCRIELNHRACSAAPSGATDAQREECAAKCRESVLAGVVARVEKAVELCVTAEGPPACSLDLATVDIHGPSGKQVTEEGRRKLQDGCVKQCSENRVANARRVKESAQAEKLGEGLVLNYKRCMMAVDSTLAARKERLYDRDLYDKRMQGVDERCRKQHRCDWLEEYSEFSCVYGN
jgi:hypothetical protein